MGSTPGVCMTEVTVGSSSDVDQTVVHSKVVELAVSIGAGSEGSVQRALGFLHMGVQEARTREDKTALTPHWMAGLVPTILYMMRNSALAQLMKALLLQNGERELKILAGAGNTATIEIVTG